MTDADMMAWKRETERLMLARARFLDSLNAIQELADFAATHVQELDKQREVTLTITSQGSEDLTPDQAKAAVSAAANLFQSLLAAVRQQPDDVVKDIENAPEDAQQVLDSKVNTAFEEFHKQFPKGVPPDTLEKMISTKRSRARTDLLLSSLLIAAVSDFEVIFSAIATYFYRLRPEALRSYDAKIPWREIETYNSIEELRDHFIDERVDKLMREGLDEWIRWLDGQLKIQFDAVAIDSHTSYELFQRRHIIVHNTGLISPQYLTKVTWLPTPPAIGAPLGVSREYLSSAIDELTVLGASLTHLTMRKLCPDLSQQAAVDEDGLMLSFTLLDEQQWKATEKVSSTILPEMRQQYDRTATQVNQWIARKRLNGAESIVDEVKHWDVSALDKMFKLAQLVLLDDPKAVTLAQELLSSGELTVKQVDTWPLFEEIRSQVHEISEEVHTEENDRPQ